VKLARFDTGFAPAVADAAGVRLYRGWARCRVDAEKAKTSSVYGEHFARLRYEEPFSGYVVTVSLRPPADFYDRQRTGQLALVRWDNWATRAVENGGPGQDVGGIVMWSTERLLRVVRESLEPGVGAETVLVGPPLSTGVRNRIVLAQDASGTFLVVNDRPYTSRAPWRYAHNPTAIRAGLVQAADPMLIDVDDFGFEVL
jgi:hypothetical protein